MLANTEYEHRFRMVGQIIVFVGFFMYLNRVVINKFSFLDYLKLLLSLFIIVLLGFRSSFAAILIASTIMIVRINGINVNIVKFFLLAVIGFSIIISTDSGEKMMRRMIDRNEESNFSNSDYIRVRQWNYFTNYHFQSNAERFFGTGIPAPGTTYYKQMMELADNYKKNLDTYVSVGQWRDWGLIGLSWVMGIPAVAVLILFIGYMIFSKTDTSHYYISSTYICLFLSSLTTIEFYRHGAFVFHGILLYLIYKLKKEKKLKLKYENWNNNTTIGK